MANKILYIIILITLGSCAVGADYERPNFSFFKDYQFSSKSSNSLLKNSDLSQLTEMKIDDSGSNSNWWKQINDPILNKYIEKLISDNLSLKQARSRILQAQSRAKISKASFLPTLGASGSASRNSTVFQGFGDSLDPIYFTNVSAQLQSSWEVDLFGRIRRSTESASALYESAKYDNEALTQSLISQMVNSRVAIAVNEKLLQLAKQNIANRKKTYDITKKRYDLGVQGASSTDVLLAKENYATVQADIGEFERRLADEIYRFESLLGQSPNSSNIRQEKFSLLTPPMEVAVCTPAKLLDRRPDLQANELRLKASNADIGVAIADLYPSLNLSGNLGVIGDELKYDVFSPDRLVGAIIGSITSRLFEGGRLRENIKLQKEEAKELTYAYSQNILDAMGEVESALKAEKELKKELELLQESANLSRKTAKIAKDRYESGVITLRELLDIEQRKYQIEQIAILRGQQKWNARVALYLALGGNWQANNENDEKEGGC